MIALPLKGRQFLDLAMLSEGVVRPPGGTRGDAMQQAGNLVNVLGQRSGHNLYLIDGATVTDEHFNNMVVAPSVDSIDEFNIQKTSYPPEFGGKSGAVINEARFGAPSVAGGQGSPNQGINFVALHGIQGVSPNPLDTGYPQVSLGGLFTTMGDPGLFTFRNNRDFEVYDKTSHCIAAGTR